MKSYTLIFGIFLTFLLVSSGLFYAKNISSDIPNSESTLTKAICDNKNYCEDYRIDCKGKDVVKLTPTGAAVQFSEEWKDPRTQEDKIIDCN